MIDGAEVSLLSNTLLSVNIVGRELVLGYVSFFPAPLLALLLSNTSPLRTSCMFLE